VAARRNEPLPSGEIRSVGKYLSMLDFATLRSEFSSNEHLAFAPIQDGEGWRDAHSRQRFRVLSALQYDRRDDDYELLHFILEQEVLRAENDPFQGIGTALQLVAWLVCRFRKPVDFPLMLRAKVANFDTHLGFDAEHLFFCGIERTGYMFAEWLRFRPDDDWVRKLQERYDFQQVDIDLWFEQQERLFPGDQSEESRLSVFDRLRELGEMQEAKNCLDQWEAETVMDRSNLSTLKSNRRSLGQFEKAAKVTHQLLQLESAPFEKQLLLGDLVELLTKAGQGGAAFENLGPYIKMVQQEDWKRLGLGLYVMERCFQLALLDFEQAHLAFQEGHRLYKERKKASLFILNLASRAATKVGEACQARKYAQLAAKEQKRIGRL
jgi:hypothetical protein